MRTPGIWSYDIAVYGNGYAIHGDDGGGSPEHVATVSAFNDFGPEKPPGRARENAEFIVRACNSYEPMLSALKTAASVYGELRPKSGANTHTLDAYLIMVEAIRLAEGGKP